MEKNTKQRHPLVKIIEFSLPKKKLDDDIIKRINKLAKKTKIQGFRPGKVPMSIIKDRYGESVKSEAVEIFAKEVINEKVKGEKIASKISYNQLDTDSENRQ